MFQVFAFLLMPGIIGFVHDLVLANRQLLPAGAVKIAAISGAALYGKGIFSTLAVHDRKPFLWEKHWRRLERNSGGVGLDLSGFNEDETRNALIELINANGVTEGRARISFVDESPSDLWPYRSSLKTSLLITTADFQPQPENLRLTISRHRINSRSPLAGIKSCNNLEKLLARDEVKVRGFDEAVQLSERGEIASACMANVFWLKDGKLFTPSLESGCLAGTTREFVMENIECTEMLAEVEVLMKADEIFLTSAGRGIIQVDELDGRPLNRRPHAITKLIPALA